MNGSKKHRRIAILAPGAIALAIVSAVALGQTAAPAHPDPKPAPNAKTPAAHVRYFVGGDSRDDHAGVIPWAFREAKARGVSGFIFLGDMELSPELDAHFEKLLAQLDPIPFFPVLGNHEVLRFGRFPLGEASAQTDYRNRFLGTPRTPSKSSIEGRVVYSADLAGGVHFIALDNVSKHGFGAEQLSWLSQDLEKCRVNLATRFVIAGMHKPLAHNGITNHSMDEDGAQAVTESDAVLALFQKHHVSAIFASHLHEFDEFKQGDIPTYITGGLGAPITHNGDNRSFHHLLQLDVDDGLKVSVVRFEGKESEPAGNPE